MKSVFFLIFFFLTPNRKNFRYNKHSLKRIILHFRKYASSLSCQGWYWYFSCVCARQCFVGRWDSFSPDVRVKCWLYTFLQSTHTFNIVHVIGIRSTFLPCHYHLQITCTSVFVVTEPAILRQNNQFLTLTKCCLCLNLTGPYTQRCDKREIGNWTLNKPTLQQKRNVKFQDTCGLQKCTLPTFPLVIELRFCCCSQSLCYAKLTRCQLLFQH